MMPVTLSFAAAPAGHFQTYEEAGYSLWTYVGQSDALESQGDLFVRYTADTLVAERTAGGSFGAMSLKLDGFRFTGFDDLGQLVPSGAGNTIEVVGYTYGGERLVHTVVTDALLGFETFTLPAGFGAGLAALTVQAQDGSGLFRADDIVLQDNRAPVAAAFSASGAADVMFTGRLTGSDADGQALTFSAVGETPEGVYLDTDGTVYVLPTDAGLDLVQGQTRVVSFDFTVSDGEATSAAKTASFTLQGVAVGQVINGTASADELFGDRGPDTINGLADEDYLSGGRGADLLAGGAGADWLDGGHGADTLSGGTGVDTFAFNAGSGSDVIADYQPDVVQIGLDLFGLPIEIVLFAGDEIRFDAAMWGEDASFAGVMSHATQAGAHTVFAYEGDDGLAHTLTVQNTALSAFRPDDFLFW